LYVVCGPVMGLMEHVAAKFVAFLAREKSLVISPEPRVEPGIYPFGACETVFGTKDEPMSAT